MSAITERDLKKAAKIWSYCVIAHIDHQEDWAEHTYTIKVLAVEYAENQLKKLGVNYPYQIQNETQALKFVLRQKRFAK